MSCIHAKLSHVKWKYAFRTCVEIRMQSNLGIHCPLPESLDTIEWMVNALKFHTPKCQTILSMQTVQAQIRLSSLIRVYTVCHSSKYSKKQLYKKQNLNQKVWNKVLEILGHLLYQWRAKAQTKLEICAFCTRLQTPFFAWSSPTLYSDLLINIYSCLI